MEAGVTLDDMFQEWRNPCLAAPELEVPEWGTMCERVGYAPHQPSVSHQALQTARALGQVARKFIPVICGSTLAVLDQHAAHERVRLEELRKQVKICAAFWGP